MSHACTPISVGVTSPVLEIINVNLQRLLLMVSQLALDEALNTGKFIHFLLLYNVQIL